MKAIALITETFTRRRSILYMHLGMFAFYAIVFTNPQYANDQWGEGLFYYAGCALPLLLTFGIMSEDISSGRIGLLLAHPLRMADFYIWRVVGVCAQCAAHLALAWLSLTVLHLVTGAGDLAGAPGWFAATLLVAFCWTSLSATLSCVMRSDRNSMVLALAAGAMVTIRILTAGAPDSSPVVLMRQLVRLADAGGPPVTLLREVASQASVSVADLLLAAGHVVVLGTIYTAAGILLLSQREFRRS